jgi:hypothetical protein
VILASLLATSQFASAFYIPGVAPTSYKKDELVPLHVNTIKPLAGPDAMLHSVVSYDYYHPLFQFCQPKDGPQDVRESLGGILFGDRIKTSPFELKMKHNESCKALCEVTYNKQTAAWTVDHSQVTLPGFYLEVDDAGWHGKTADIVRERLATIHFVKSLLQSKIQSGIQSILEKVIVQSLPIE